MSLPSQSQIQAWWKPRCTGPFAWISLHGKGRVQVRASLWEAVAALNAILIAYAYLTRAEDTGAGNCRPKVSGLGWSMHAFWIALDLNWSTNPYGSRLITDMPAEMVRRICAIRTKNGRQVWNWGGYWRGNKDAMHFEVVCSPADLAHGIDWTTVWRGGATPPPYRPPTTTPPPYRPPAASAPDIAAQPSFTPPTGGTVRFFITDPSYGIRLVITDGTCVMDFGVTKLEQLSGPVPTPHGGPMSPSEFAAFCAKYPGGRFARGHLPS